MWLAQVSKWVEGAAKTSIWGGHNADEIDAGCRIKSTRERHGTKLGGNLMNWIELGIDWLL